MPVVLRDAGPRPTATPTATATLPATATPTTTATQPPPLTWLEYFNNLRELGALPTLDENTSWSNGCWLHSRYMVKNDVIQHSEDPANPWYTADGQAAAQNSNLAVDSDIEMTDYTPMDRWMTGPFHGVGMIDPALAVTGFGSYREAIGLWQAGACLDVIRGRGSIPPSVVFPVMWPGAGSLMPYAAYEGGESPDPLSSCPGYSEPSGPPIYLLIGAGSLTPNVTAHAFWQGSTPLEHCVYDETNYTNPNASYQSLGRSILNGRNAIILIPREPLTPGLQYTVSITNSGQEHTWSFTVSSSVRRQSVSQGMTR